MPEMGSVPLCRATLVWAEGDGQPQSERAG